MTPAPLRECSGMTPDEIGSKRLPCQHGHLATTGGIHTDALVGRPLRRPMPGARWRHADQSARVSNGGLPLVGIGDRQHVPRHRGKDHFRIVAHPKAGNAPPSRPGVAGNARDERSASLPVGRRRRLASSAPAFRNDAWARVAVRRRWAHGARRTSSEPRDRARLGEL